MAGLPRRANAAAIDPDRRAFLEDRSTVALSSASSQETRMRADVAGATTDAWFVVLYRPGPTWRMGHRVTDQDLGAHFRFIEGLFEAGRVTLAGPFLDDTGGMAVVRAQDRAEAERTLASDPAVVSGVMVGELRPYHAAFDAARPRPSRVPSAATNP